MFWGSGARGKYGAVRGFAGALGAFWLALAAPAGAADLAAIVRDGSGSPVADAVIHAVPAGPSAAAAAAAPASAVVDQVNAQFAPFVTPVQAGANVTITNADPYGHNLYSVSEARAFNLPVSRDVAVQIVFDQPGVVVLGCNIHDWMVAYLLVLETPHFAVTSAQGSAVLRNLPPGSYRVSVWHPGLREDMPPQTVDVTEGALPSLAFEVELQRQDMWKLERPAR